jgi:hypothetical protein
MPAHTAVADIVYPSEIAETATEFWHDVDAAGNGVSSQ